MTRAPKRNNARLEWRGRKLMCNGVEVAEVRLMGIKTPPWWACYRNWDSRHRTEAAARRAVSRRFGMEDVK